MIVEVPGRVNLIGEHIDYLGYPVLPMAISRRLRLDFQPLDGPEVRVQSADYGSRQFAWVDKIEPWPAGDFGNYVKAAAQAAGRRWGIAAGFEGSISSSIPPAAGLSSSSALVIAATIALLKVRGIRPEFQELMEVLPEGEMYVGTRGGGMDHAVCLAGRQGCALRVEFHPVTVKPIPIPAGWAFFVAHSLQRAEKSGAAREDYNQRRALAEAGDPRALRHAHSERQRVDAAIQAINSNDVERFGEILNASHRSLRDNLKVSCERADKLVEMCTAAGALGARIMGAGFGGYVVGLCREESVSETMARLERDHFSALPERAGYPDYLMRVEAGDGALASL